MKRKASIVSTKSATSDTSKTQGLSDQFDVSSPPDVPMSLKSAISYFSDIEAKYDQAIQDQDVLIREINQRIPRTNVSDGAQGLLVPMMLTPTARSEFHASDLPYDEFRKMAELANKVVKKQMPMATKRFMSQAGRYEIDQIEQLEANITILRQHMRNVELQIMNHTPRSGLDVALKLKFLAALMLDGGEVEMDYFAYLIEECAEILEDDVTLISSMRAS